MLGKPQVLVKFKTGEQVLFSLADHNAFVKLVEQVSKVWGLWLFIGPDAVVRKKDISSMYYLPEGYENRKSYLS